MSQIVNVKLDWVRTLESSESDEVKDVAAMPGGGAVAFGQTLGGLVGAKEGESTNGWLARYDAQGNQLWGKQIAGVDHADHMVVGDDGSIYVLMSTTTTVGQLDHHHSTLSGGEPDNGIADALLIKYGADGERQWAHQFGSGDLDSPEHVALGKNGQVYVTVGVAGAAGAGDTEPNENDIALYSFTDSGSALGLNWVKMIGSTPRDGEAADKPVAGLEVDGETGNILIAGQTEGSLATLRIGGGEGTTVASPNHSGSGKSFLMEVTPEGNVVQTTQFMEDRHGSGTQALTQDHRGNPVLAGEVDYVFIEGSSTPERNMSGEHGTVFSVKDGTVAWGHQAYVSPDTGGTYQSMQDVDLGPGRLIYGFGRDDSQTKPFMNIYHPDGTLIRGVVTEFEPEGFHEPNHQALNGELIAGAASGTGETDVLYVVGTDGEYAPNAEKADVWVAQFSVDFNIEAAEVGTAYRLYKAAFDRSPDPEGLAYWVGRLGEGMTEVQVAQSFTESTEFRDTYGAAASNETFIEKLYQNVLDREADDAGKSYWLDDMANNGRSRADVLHSFAISEENVGNVASLVQEGQWYL